ncbi:hypothetical protein C8R46DRAFT_1058536 [Mycena filopes]|nr:hypothetical protein C8R46DRAFT_1058536 [Mycena filopes]
MRLHLSLLFNPVFRVWTFRFLLALISLIIIESWNLPMPLPLSGYTWLVLACLSIAHHILAVFRWPITSLAIIDLVWTLLELAGVLYTNVQVLLNSKTFISYERQDPVPIWDWQLGVFPGSILMVVTLMFSIIFRIATIAKSPESFLRQRLEFLGGCTPLHPPYNPTRILLNRSVARPLVRKESHLILFMRGLIIWCIGLGVPAFGFYSIVFAPVTTQISSQAISPFHTGQYMDPFNYYSPPGNVTLLLPSNANFSTYNIQTRVVTQFQGIFQGKPHTMMGFGANGNCVVVSGSPWFVCQMSVKTLIHCSTQHL